MGKRFFFITLLIILATWYAYSLKRDIRSKFEASSQSENILKKLPAVNFKDFNGQTFSTTEKTNGDLIFVHFWATWCAPCLTEMPELLALIHSFKGSQGIQFWLVAVNDDLLKVKKFIQSLPVGEDFPVIWLLDNDLSHSRDFGTARIPETYFFGRNLGLIKKFIGAQNWKDPAHHQLLLDHKTQ